MDLLKASDTLQALTFLSQHPHARIIAGGSDLIIKMRKKKIKPEALVDVSDLADLKGVAREGSLWTIGAAATLQDLLDSSMGEELSGLIQAAHTLGSPQIRHTATTGGNICNSSPAADMVPPLLALEATLNILRLEDGSIVRHQVPLNQFFTGKGKNVLQQEELLHSIEFQALPKDTYLSFEKLGLREAVAISRICLAVLLSFDGAVVKKCRIAAGSLGETGLREYKTEEYLTGRTLTDETIEAACEILTASVKERLPGRSTLPFKEKAVRGVLKHAISGILQRRQ